MNMRIKFKHLVQVFSMLLLIAACSEQKDQFSAGTHYKQYQGILDDQLITLPELATADVIEFFTYGCRHCQSFAPSLDKWHSKNKDVNIVYVPVVWNELTEMHAKLYYLIKTYPNAKDIHHELFGLINDFSRTDSIEDQKVQIIVFLTSKGIQAKDVVAALNTSQFDTQTASSVMLTKRYEITGTPALVVDKQYKIINSTLKTHEEMLQVMSELLEKKG